MDELQILQRLEALEAQLLLVSQHLGVPCPMFASTGFTTPAAPPLPPPGAAPTDAPSVSPEQQEIVALVRNGRKLDAIKRYRQLTGADLLEAKRIIESI